MFTFIRDSENQHFMRVWWAQLISQFGDRINQMALVGLVAARHPGSVTDLAKLIARAAEFEGPVVFNSGKPEGERVKVIRSKRFSQWFLDFTFTSLEEGLRVTTEWFCDYFQGIMAPR